MRAVADTNVVGSGLLWFGPPRRVLDLARSGQIQLFTSPVLLAELEDVLARKKFRRRLELAGVELPELVLGYAALARVMVPAEVRSIITEDPEDDEVLACALTARADLVVSGDKHLLRLGDYEGIRIVRPLEVLTP